LTNTQFFNTNANTNDNRHPFRLTPQELAPLEGFLEHQTEQDVIYVDPRIHGAQQQPCHPCCFRDITLEDLQRKFGGDIKRVSSCRHILDEEKQHEENPSLSDNECPICFDFLVNIDLVRNMTDHEKEVDFLENILFFGKGNLRKCPTCKNLVHLGCMKRWMMISPHDNCVVCRSAAWKKWDRI
jgi:hypothetical protein